MDINKINLFINTIIYLKPIQIYYRIYYFVRNKIFGYNLSTKTFSNSNSISWKNTLRNNNSYINKKNTFTFLNISYSFLKKIDWNYNGFGKLWLYNLNYFDFLNQKNISKETGIILIKDFINNNIFLKEGKEPYPISVRGINWVKFLSSNNIKNKLINNILYNHYCILFKNFEYHLLGNHLLENGFSLLFGAYYFQDEKFYIKSKNLLLSELDKQLMKDGAHFELSPMYHQIILSRLLDSIRLIELNSSWKKNDLILFLKQKASLMITWLNNITYNNGSIPMVNDATFNIAPNSSDLFHYAKKLGIKSQYIPLSDSGYRKVKCNNYELFMDVGNIGPSYQPGHAHSDTLNFELSKDNRPIIVDKGISTYNNNYIRQIERSTQSHNTVKIGSKEQTQVWGGFRVAKRAKIISLSEKNNCIKATHDGYLRDGFSHERSFIWSENELIIKDKISKSTENKAIAFFHLHHSIPKPIINNKRVIIKSLGISIEYDGAIDINIDNYKLSVGFNKTRSASVIKIVFNQYLNTKILL